MTALLLAIATAATASCATSNAVTGEAQIVEITGTVKFIEVEGGFYGIAGDNGERYDPLNLSPDFQKDGLRVRIQARLRKDVVTTRMWGMPVDLISIENLDKD